MKCEKWCVIGSKGIRHFKVLDSGEPEKFISSEMLRASSVKQLARFDES